MKVNCELLVLFGENLTADLFIKRFPTLALWVRSDILHAISTDVPVAERIYETIKKKTDMCINPLEKITCDRDPHPILKEIETE